MSRGSFWRSSVSLALGQGTDPLALGRAGSTPGISVGAQPGHVRQSKPGVFPRALGRQRSRARGASADQNGNRAIPGTLAGPGPEPGLAAGAGAGPADAVACVWVTWGLVGGQKPEIRCVLQGGMMPVAVIEVGARWRGAVVFGDSPSSFLHRG